MPGVIVGLERGRARLRPIFPPGPANPGPAQRIAVPVGIAIDVIVAPPAKETHILEEVVRPGIPDTHRVLVVAMGRPDRGRRLRIPGTDAAQDVVRATRAAFATHALDHDGRAIAARGIHALNLEIVVVPQGNDIAGILAVKMDRAIVFGLDRNAPAPSAP